MNESELATMGVVRVALLGGDTRARLSVWPRGYEVTHYQGIQEQQKIINSIKSHNCDCVVVLTKWMSHSVYAAVKVACKQNDVPLRCWTRGLGELAKDFVNTVGVVKPAARVEKKPERSWVEKEEPTLRVITTVVTPDKPPVETPEAPRELKGWEKGKAALLWTSEQEEALVIAYTSCGGDVEKCARAFATLNPGRTRSVQALASKLDDLDKAKRLTISDGFGHRMKKARHLDAEMGVKLRSDTGKKRNGEPLPEPKKPAPPVVKKEEPVKVVKTEVQQGIIAPEKPFPVHGILTPETLLKRIRYYVLGVEAEDLTKEAAFDKIAKLLEG